MEARKIFEEFSLLGGPLYRLGCQLHLFRGVTSTVALGLALGVLLWCILVALAFVEGISNRLFSLSVISVHVRLLLVIPLFFLCESVLDPRLKEFVRTIVRSGVLPANELPALESEVGRTRRWIDSWWRDVLCLFVAVLLSVIAQQLPQSGTTAVPGPDRVMANLPLTIQWYWIACLTFIRFLILRWFWQLCLWWHFLWRLSKMELKLVPTHPDGVAGLGYLEVVQTHFFPLVVAISLIWSASFAENISTGKMAFEAIYPALPFILIVDAVLVLWPLYFFAPKLWASKVKGLSDYMEFASRYVNEFDRKWRDGDTAPRKSLLGTPDLQSLADLANSMNIVRTMRVAPVSPHLLIVLVLAALLPMLPLFLLKYPVTELAEKFFTKLLGL
jgi:hypothetical protein